MEEEGRREGGREGEREREMDIDGCGRIWKVMDGYGWIQIELDIDIR